MPNQDMLLRKHNVTCIMFCRELTLANINIVRDVIMDDPLPVGFNSFLAVEFND